MTSATNQNYADCENVGNNWIKKGRINCDANVAVSNVKESKRKKTTQSPRPDRSNASCVTIKKPPAAFEVKNISVQVSESACLFWDTETSAWKTTGCRERE